METGLPPIQNLLPPQLLAGARLTSRLRAVLADRAKVETGETVRRPWPSSGLPWPGRFASALSKAQFGASSPNSRRLSRKSSTSLFIASGSPSNSLASADSRDLRSRVPSINRQIAADVPESE